VLGKEELQQVEIYGEQQHPYHVVHYFVEHVAERDPFSISML
jgi:hypothetical protein